METLMATPYKIIPQMTDESNYYAIEIATLGDWFKNLPPIY